MIEGLEVQTGLTDPVNGPAQQDHMLEQVLGHPVNENLFNMDACLREAGYHLSLAIAQTAMSGETVKCLLLKQGKASLVFH